MLVLDDPILVEVREGALAAGTSGSAGLIQQDVHARYRANGLAPVCEPPWREEPFLQDPLPGQTKSRDAARNR